MCEITGYLTASSNQTGALGIFHVYGDESALAGCLDRRLGTKKRLYEDNRLTVNELRYGWLWGTDDFVVDEVMLAKPVDGMRVLMTHGGAMIRDAVEAHFAAMGIAALDACSDVCAWNGAVWQDELWDAALSRCVTERQAAALRAYRDAVENGRAAAQPDAALMAVHRVVLCGPPNAGKSSLLNALAGYDRAFVDAKAGATRDVVDELVDVGGYAVLLGDLPGFAENDQGLGATAWEMAAKRVEHAEFVWFVCDVSIPWENGAAAAAEEMAQLLESAAGKRHAPKILVVLNKSDLPSALAEEPWQEYFPGAASVAICSLPEGNARSVLGEAIARILAP